MRPRPLAFVQHVNRLLSRGSAAVNVIIVQHNGRVQQERPLHVLEIAFAKLKFRRADKTRFKEEYNAEMQVCGARGGGDAAAQGLFINLKGEMSVMVACESAKVGRWQVEPRPDPGSLLLLSAAEAKT
jgi:hypothetical protein